MKMHLSSFTRTLCLTAATVTATACGALPSSGIADDRQTGALATSQLLEYDYGNQITHSELVLYRDGLMRVGEKKCGGCPVDRREMSLRKAVLEDIVAAVEAAGEGRQATKPGGPTTFGSRAGFLKAWTSTGGEVNIRTVQRAHEPGPGKLDTITFSDSPATAKIHAFINTYVEVQMPVD